jgi:hypothetical protein
MSVWSSDGYHAVKTKSAHGNSEKAAQLEPNGQLASFMLNVRHIVRRRRTILVKKQHIRQVNFIATVTLII